MLLLAPQNNGIQSDSMAVFGRRPTPSLTACCRRSVNSTTVSFDSMTLETELNRYRNQKSHNQRVLDERLRHNELLCIARVVPLSPLERHPPLEIGASGFPVTTCGPEVNSRVITVLNDTVQLRRRSVNLSVKTFEHSDFTGRHFDSGRAASVQTVMFVDNRFENGCRRQRSASICGPARAAGQDNHTPQIKNALTKVSRWQNAWLPAEPDSLEVT